MYLRIHCGRCTGPVGIVSLPELGPALMPTLTLLLRKMGVKSAGSSLAGIEAIDPQTMGNALRALCPVCLVELGVSPSLSLSQNLDYGKITEEAPGQGAPASSPR